MATYDDLKARIADDLARSDLGNQIIQHIQSAISFYAGEYFSRLYNNPQTVTTFSTVAGEQHYNIDTIASTIESDLFLSITNGGEKERLKKITINEVENLRDDYLSLSTPKYYAVYGHYFTLHPIPDKVYVITVGFIKNLADLVNGTDSNFWTNEAEELIRTRAKKTLYRDVISDFDNYQLFDIAEKETYKNLKISTERRLSTNRIAAGL